MARASSRRRGEAQRRSRSGGHMSTCVATRARDVEATDEAPREVWTSTCTWTSRTCTHGYRYRTHTHAELRRPERARGIYRCVLIQMRICAWNNIRIHCNCGRQPRRVRALCLHHAYGFDTHVHPLPKFGAAARAHAAARRTHPVATCIPRPNRAPTAPRMCMCMQPSPRPAHAHAHACAAASALHEVHARVALVRMPSSCS